jgi:hypothetical protein
MENKLIKVLTVDLKLTLYSSLNSFHNSQVIKKCNCQKYIEKMLETLDKTTVIDYTNLLLERGRREREGQMKTYDPSYCYACPYKHIWFEANTRTYLFAHPNKKINQAVYVI